MMNGIAPFVCKAWEERKAKVAREQAKARRDAQRELDEEKRAAEIAAEQANPDHIRSRLRSGGGLGAMGRRLEAPPCAGPQPGAPFGPRMLWALRSLSARR